MRGWKPSLRPAVVLIVLLALTLTLAAGGCGAAVPGSGQASTSAPTTTNDPGTTVPPTTAGASDPGSTAAGFQVAMSNIARLAPPASTANIEAAAASLQAFGADLYRVLAAGAGDGNLVFSPSSIVTALAMTYAGARGLTAEEMAKTLHFTLQGDALHDAFNSLDKLLQSRTWNKKNDDGKEEGILLKTANSLWAQSAYHFERAFLDSLAANYGAGVHLVDFKAAAEAARQAVNKWVAGETNDKIPELIGPGIISEMTRLILVNAVYLDATWQSQFDPALTKDGQFSTLAGSRVTTKMMSQTTSLPYAEGDGWQAVQLPYAGNQLAMTLIVPDSGKFSEVEGGLAGGLIGDVTRALSDGTELNLTLPKFAFRTQAALNDALQALGMKTAFTDAADFSGMTGKPDLFIKAVIHEAFIEVDEEGTEAAAATAVIMDEKAAFIPAKTLTIDRPFVFAVTDKESGAILFMGRVTDPTQ